MKTAVRTLLITLGAVLLAGCSQPADVASRNLSTAADNFEIQRRIVFYNGITDTYMLEVTGRCSLGNEDQPGQLSITCKTGPEAFKKHFLGLSDNVTHFVEQIDGAGASDDSYRVVFRPETIIPDVELG